MWDFMFEAVRDGYRFFVECDTLEEANKYLEYSGIDDDEVRFCGRYTDEEAEILGLDTYSLWDDDDYDDCDNDMGFDPYMGCYSDDC